ncbi:MAG: hypothetical protein FWG69_02755 [Oscillospiraceae bacterium]|nr:hypothetical protein [Oscillospiraceae bacterium]
MKIIKYEWRRFEKTGEISDYLRYKQSIYRNRESALTDISHSNVSNTLKEQDLDDDGQDYRIDP